jgi:hypothetical protein
VLLSSWKILPYYQIDAKSGKSAITSAYLILGMELEGAISKYARPRIKDFTIPILVDDLESVMLPTDTALMTRVCTPTRI